MYSVSFGTTLSSRATSQQFPDDVGAAPPDETLPPLAVAVPPHPKHARALPATPGREAHEVPPRPPGFF